MNMSGKTSAIIPLRQEYMLELARVRGWLLFFYIFSILTILAYFRVSMASVMTGMQHGRTDWILGVVLLVGLVGLSKKKPWGYYVLVAFGAFQLLSMGWSMIQAPDQMLFRDWMFDMPILGEWLIVLAWFVYFLYSRRVYSVFFGSADK